MKVKQANRRLRRGFFSATFAALVVALAMAAIPAVPAAQGYLYERELNSQQYKENNGRWDVPNVPEQFRIRSIHAVSLYTGKTLLMAGSGNSEQNFEDEVYQALLVDPLLDSEDPDAYELIEMPHDLFCAGQVTLPDGKILIAGGTRRYEKLTEVITRAAGVMNARNRQTVAVIIPKGTEFVSPSGVVFRSSEKVRIPPADSILAGNGKVVIKPGVVRVWVEAANEGDSSVIDVPTRYSVLDAQGETSTTLYGTAPELNMDQQDFQGLDVSYIFDPATERFQRVSNMVLARWYPTLVRLLDGSVLALSGLDQHGDIINGDTERYDPVTGTWTLEPELNFQLPTYPAMFPIRDPLKLFYTASNSGYGSPEIGRTPGIWDLQNNTFEVIKGLRDPDMTETSASLLLPPAQLQRFAIVGGGGVGDSNAASSRIDIVDLKENKPTYRPAGRLSVPTRYPNTVILPDDNVLVSNGSAGYRGVGTDQFKQRSDLSHAYLFNPKTEELKPVADTRIGRSYHSQALLLLDGRVLTVGGDPLQDETGYGPGSFETQHEIYSPPYLFKGPRPEIVSTPQLVEGGVSVSVVTPDASQIGKVRLIQPGSATHVTNVEQRSVAVSFKVTNGGLRLRIPADGGILPPGPYMLFLVTKEGVPSIGRWVRVV